MMLLKWLIVFILAVEASVISADATLYDNTDTVSQKFIIEFTAVCA